MNKMKKLLSVVLAVVLALSAFSIMGSAARTNYKTVDELTALDAYSPYGQVTRLSLEERTSIVFDALDNLLAKTNINMGKVFDVLGLSVTIDLTSIDRLCYSFDTIKSTFTNTLASIAMGIVNLGILESLEVDTWATGMSRDATANYTILSEILEFLSNNTNLVNQVFTNGLDLGIVSLGDMSAIEDVIGDLPGLVKGLVFPLIERWDDPVSLIKEYDTASKGNGNVESIVNKRVKKLFSDNMSITTIKYDADGNMTSEHTNWLATATGSAAPTASNDSLRYYYQIVGNTMYSYHIVDQAEAEALAKAGKSATVHTYIQENQVYRLEQEVDGSATYVWKAYELDENGSVVKDAEGNDKYLGTLKYYNDDSQFLPGFSGDKFDLTTMSAGDLLYTFIPTVFENMAPVVLNGSVKKALAEFVGVTFTYVGQGGTELDDAVNALPDSSNAFFTEEQGEYLWEWSNYAVINGTHYYRFENQIFKGDHSKANNYFDIINWDFKVTGDFMNEFVPENADDSSVRLLNNVTKFLNKVGNLVLLPSAATKDEVSGYEAQWTRPTFADGNANLVENIKDLAQAIVGLAPQHIFGSDYATNERCYVELMLAGTDKGVTVPAGMTENDVILTGIAAHLVDMLMPSMTLPGKSELLASGAKVGAILAAVVREFAAYLAPEYDFDALIYTDFGATDGGKNFVTGKDSEYWLDVILTMGINVGYEYLRAFADMGEGTTEWNAFVAASGYKVDGGVYTEADLKLDNETANHWEAMVDYIVDWALEKDYEWTWKMENLVKVDGLTIALSTVENPWVKLDKILDNLLPIDEIITVDEEEKYRSGTELEKLLRYDLILGIVDLRWADLIALPDFATAKVNGTTNLFRQDNVIDALATLLKSIVNGIFAKVGNSSDNFKLIPDAITDFDSLANQANLKTMIVNLVGAIYNAGVTDKGCDTLFPFLNFLLGWKTDPQQIKDPEIWTSFRDGNDYAFQWTDNGVYPSIDADNTLIKVLNNSSGMLETHRNSSVTDHAYDIQIKSVTSDAKTNTLTFTYGDGNGLVSPYETLDIKIGGTYNGEEATTITIAYDYVGKDGKAIGGTQYTSLTFLVSNQYEDANIEGRRDGDDDRDYTGTNQFKKFVFTEDIYTSVTTYEPTIFYVKPSINLGDKSKNFSHICANGEQQDCNGNITEPGQVATGQSTEYFEWIRDQKEAGWEDSISDGNPASGRLYKAKAGVTAETEFPYGSYDMGNIAVVYGGNMVYEVNFIYYNDFDIYDIYTENKDNGYNANQGVATDVYNRYNEAWKMIVYGATYPMMTEMNGNAATDYVLTIQPYIPAAIEEFEAAKEAYETALADAQANAAGDAASDLPAYVTALRQEIENDFMNGKEINFQDYNFYEYFNYNDVKEDAEALYRSYLAPEIMDTCYIFNSGIREAELELVVNAEANATKQTAINASKRLNDQAAIDASIAARNDWQQPINTKLIVDDMTSRLAFYKEFLNATNMEDANRDEPAHLKFLEREIAFVEAQGLVADDYESVTWGKYAAALETAKAVAAGEDEFSEFNSRIYDVKYNLMVAYKQLLTKANSLIEAGGTADLLANIEVAEGILAMNIDEIELSDLAIEKGLTKEKALGHLIEGLGYYYQARYSKHDVEVQDGEKTAGELKYNGDGTPMMFNLYDESAYEYADNDRPNKQANQAKVDAVNDNLEACIAYFAVETAEPVLGGLETGIVDTENGYVYGVTAGEDVNLFFSVENGSFKMVANDQGVTNGTGATLVVMNDKGDEVGYFTLVIFGDVNGDGAITAADSDTVGIAALGGTIEGDAYNFAADVNADATTTAADSDIISIAALGGEITINPYEAA